MDTKRQDPENGNIDNNKAPEAPVASSEEHITPSPMPRRSRLSKTSFRKSRNTMILSILGIVAILFLLFRYGIPLISDASFLFGKITSSPNENEEETNEEFVPIPRLNSLPKATKDESIKVTGKTIAGLDIEIYLNGDLVDEVTSNDSGGFESVVELTNGENLIKAKAKKNETTSDYSNTVSITVKREGPELTIESPADGGQISGGNPIEVKGKTDPDSSVVVNEFKAIVNSRGEWSYFLTLNGGDNDIKVSSTDAAGNMTEKAIRVHYSQ